MNFKGIEKKEAGKFITRYDITYETVDNQKKVYEIISRKKDMETYEALHGDKPDAVVIIATNETGDKLLVNKEFRLAVGDWVYNFPAGLIDPGEKPQESARRELWEETGAQEFDLTPVCTYSVRRDGQTTYGMLYAAEITRLGPLPPMEIERIELFDQLPDKERWTYPAIQPLLVKTVMELGLAK